MKLHFFSSKISWCPSLFHLSHVLAPWLLMALVRYVAKLPFFWKVEVRFDTKFARHLDNFFWCENNCFAFGFRSPRKKKGNFFTIEKQDIFTKKIHFFSQSLRGCNEVYSRRLSQCFSITDNMYIFIYIDKIYKCMICKQNDISLWTRTYFFWISIESRWSVASLWGADEPTHFDSARICLRGNGWTKSPAC